MELVVWQHSRTLTQEIFRHSQGFPGEEKFSLSDQIRRSSRSIGAQIAEAWGKRRNERHFISKLTDADADADAEQYETQHWLIQAYDAGYLNRDEVSDLGRRCKAIGSMIGGMISVSHQFCQGGDSTTGRKREDSTLDRFFAPPPDGLFGL